jgi:hypothetical protein
VLQILVQALLALADKAAEAMADKMLLAMVAEVAEVEPGEIVVLALTLERVTMSQS